MKSNPIVLSNRIIWDCRNDTLSTLCGINFACGLSATHENKVWVRLTQPRRAGIVVSQKRGDI
eukprot:COSAG03_NODE_5072_length_1346_cov_1.756215_1_plen_62_part_10